MSNEFAGQLVGIDNVSRYAFGGHAVFTVVSKKTGTRFTYKLSLPKEKAGSKYPAPDPLFGPFFAKVLTGPDNCEDFEFVGTVRRDSLNRISYAHSSKSRIGATAPSVGALQWFLYRLQAGGSLDQAEVFHAGTCCRCGRPLTVPESVASGIGPICAGRE